MNIWSTKLGFVTFGDDKDGKRAYLGVDTAKDYIGGHGGGGGWPTAPIVSHVFKQRYRDTHARMRARAPIVSHVFKQRYNDTHGRMRARARTLQMFYSVIRYIELSLILCIILNNI